jgi:LacI family transcriptional regulator
VSTKTVSRVVAGTARVSPETSAKVLSAVETLRFRPNTIARELRNGGVATTVGFVIGDLMNPFYSAVAFGVIEALAEAGLNMALSATNDQPEIEATVVGSMLERRVRALLLVPIAEDHAYLNRERALGTPIVALSRPLANADSDSVTLDNVGGARQAVELLVAAGHRRIAFLGSSRTIYNYGQRAGGYLTALESVGLPVDPALLRDDAPNVELAGRAMAELLRLADPPTAVFAANNRAAIGAYAAIQAAGVAVSMVAFDEFELAAPLGVSVIQHDAVLMGTTAVDLAVQRTLDLAGAVQHVVLPTTLITRRSHLAGWTPPS